MAEENPLQAYFDWQVTTVMLAHDLVDPLPPEDPDAHEERRKAIELEVSELSKAQFPEELLNDPSKPWPRDLMRKITQATLARAHELAVQAG